MNRIGEMYRDGDSVPQDKVKAKLWLGRAARRGSANGMNDLGLLFCCTRGIPTDYPEALYWFRRSSELGNSDAMSSLGLMYFEARGVPKDYDQAREWWTRAVAQNNSDSMGNLGWLYQLGLGVPQDLDKAARLYGQSAALGNGGALVKLGLLYEKGTGVPKDLNKAVQYLEKAAELNDAEAMYALGELSEGLHELPRDAAKAQSWYERAASVCGNAEPDVWPAEWAMGRLANSYESGRFTEQNYQLAMQWYQKLAALNDPNAMDRIAYLYSQGQGVPKDETEAQKWSARAAALRPPPKPVTPNCSDRDLAEKLRIFMQPGFEVAAWEITNRAVATCMVRSYELHPNEIAHSSRRWRTTAADGTSNGCHSEMDNSHLGKILMISPALLAQACSEIQFNDYAAGPFVPDWPAAKDNGLPPEPKLTLTAPKQQYIRGENLPLHVTVSDGDATWPRSKQGCPILLRSITDPSGSIRIDEMTPTSRAASDVGGRFRIAKTCWDRYGYLPPTASLKSPTSSEPSEFDFDGTNQLNEKFPSTIRFLSFAGSTTFGEIRLVETNTIDVDFKDAADVPRTWGVTEQGVRVNLTLDKTQFQVGEDIAAHIAAQVVEALEPVYDEPYVRTGAFFQSIAGGFHLSISDEDGPLENTDRRANLYYGFGGGSSGPIVCPGPLDVGKVIPLERSLGDIGLLPKRPGTYQLSVTWSPYHSRFSTCPNQRPEQPFITVTSNMVTITVVGEPPATALPPFPEYTAWKEHFRLVDTAFGSRTAMLDFATGLAWLRPTLTSEFNVPVTEQSLAARMAQENDFAGWRFATRDEVRSYFAHFTDSKDGTSQDPAVERKLLRLLGGTIGGTPNEGGRIDNRITVRIAGSTQEELWDYYAFVREGWKDGHTEATIDPEQHYHGQRQAMIVFEGGTTHYAGFFVVRQTIQR